MTSKPVFRLIWSKYWTPMRPRQHPVLRQENPSRSELKIGLDEIYKFDGALSLETLLPSNAYWTELSITFRDAKFMMTCFARGLDESASYRQEDDPMKELFVFWAPNDEVYRGQVRFGEDTWDARMICSDFGLATKMLEEFYETATFQSDTKQCLRHRDDPKGAVQ